MKRNELDELVHRAKRGDGQAAEEFRAQVLPGLEIIVRQVLTHGRPNTDFARWVCTLYSETVRKRHPTTTMEISAHAVSIVAGWLCDQIIREFDQQRIEEHALRETLLN